ncbi:unnamed protein product [Rhizophagus irregularis]|nr:unnamed protein product [Rhizophagus irregularis]
MTSHQISKNNKQTSSANQPVIVCSPFTQLIARGTTRFTWSNAPVNASLPFTQLTRPGTMRLTWSNAKPNLLKAKNKRKRKAAAEENNIESWNKLIIINNHL